MDEQADMERNIAKRTGQKEREEMEREKQRTAQHRLLLFFGEEEREVSLVITRTDREEDEGREVAE